MREIFDNVVSQVRILVNDQITAIEEKEGRLPKVIYIRNHKPCKVMTEIRPLFWSVVSAVADTSTISSTWRTSIAASRYINQRETNREFGLKIRFGPIF